MHKLVCYLFFIFLASCSNPNPYNCKVDQTVISKNDSILNSKEEKKSYNFFLKRTHEPRMDASSEKTYRLTIHYSFERNYWIYRIKQTSYGGLLTLKKTYQKAYKEYCGARDTMVVKKISQKEWKKIEYVVNSNCFWTMPLSDSRHGLDGASYIVEAFDPEADNPIGRNYAAVIRWSPEQGTGFRTICDAIEDLDNKADK